MQGSIIFWEPLCEGVAPPLFDMFSRNFFSLGKGNYYGLSFGSSGTLGMQSRWGRVYLTPILKVGGCNTRGPKASPHTITIRVYATRTFFENGYTLFCWPCLLPRQLGYCV
jgi:hypothetical protein